MLMTQICLNPKWPTLQATSTKNGHIIQTNSAIDLKLVSRPMFLISRNAFNTLLSSYIGLDSKKYPFDVHSVDDVLKLQYLFVGNRFKQRLPQVFISDVCYIEPGAQINELLHSKDLLVGGKQTYITSTISNYFLQP